MGALSFKGWGAYLPLREKGAQNVVKKKENLLPSRYKTLTWQQKIGNFNHAQAKKTAKSILLQKSSA